MAHRLHQLIKTVNKTHKGLGPMIAFNLLAAKSGRCILNVAPAGCGKSTATNVVFDLLKPEVARYGSITLAGLHFLADKMKGFRGHIIVDDLGAEKSVWSRVATVSTLSHLCYSHSVSKYTQALKINITDFYGSIAFNVQPVLMQGIVDSEDWVAVVRDKIIRYYHLFRPANPKVDMPKVEFTYGPSIDKVTMKKYKGKNYYRLLTLGLYQWSAARCNEHIPALLKACAALDGRYAVNTSDYVLLAKLMKNFSIERHIIETYGFESARFFMQNPYYLLVELASFSKVTLEQICVDYKVSMRTVQRLLETVKDWCYLENNSPKLVKPTGYAAGVLKNMGAQERW